MNSVTKSRLLGSKRLFFAFFYRNFAIWNNRCLTHRLSLLALLHDDSPAIKPLWSLLSLSYTSTITRCRIENLDVALQAVFDACERLDAGCYKRQKVQILSAHGEIEAFIEVASDTVADVIPPEH